MRAICDICGKTSGHPTLCSLCGNPILSDQEIAALPASRGYGWATFKLGGENAGALCYLRRELSRMEEFTFLRLLRSQLPMISDGDAQVSILMDEGFLTSIRRDIMAHFPGVSVDFSLRNFSTAAEGDELVRTYWDEQGDRG
ncbi:hypothetical protein INH39_23005 [Massilia violaceinigra]|uniref:Uncharacterized protein n=1 Tax=Massilia violaceinigra TaxID=2045208 RepID=A0ABY4A0V4_9BURK|nr:hypothetical protein [Massilia violaceinigra]UOD28303.1 hypothetical protein INH39_23005 [Massilia violaceinigra]